LLDIQVNRHVVQVIVPTHSDTDTLMRTFDRLFTWTTIGRAIKTESKIGHAFVVVWIIRLKMH